MDVAHHHLLCQNLRGLRRYRLHTTSENSKGNLKKSRAISSPRATFGAYVSNSDEVEDGFFDLEGCGDKGTDECDWFVAMRTAPPTGAAETTTNGCCEPVITEQAPAGLHAPAPRGAHSCLTAGIRLQSRALTLQRKTIAWS